MKKTLLIALGMLSLQAHALTITVSKTEDITLTINTSEDYYEQIADGRTISYSSSNGYLTGWDTKDGLTLTLIGATGENGERWSTQQYLIYTSAVLSDGTVSPNSYNGFGIMAMADGSVTGIDKTAVWDNTNNETGAASMITDTVTVTLEKNSKGTVMLDNKGSEIIGMSGLRYSAATTTNSYINKALITSVTLSGTVNAEWTLNTDKVEKVFACSEVAVLTAATANDGSKTKITPSSDLLGKGSIVVGGDTQLFVESHGATADFSISDDIYIGQTSFSEYNYSGVAIRFGNNGSVKTNITGNIYLVEDASIRSGGTMAIEISGSVTDVVDGVNTGSTLTVTGSGFTFSGDVKLTGLTLNSSVAFTGSVNVGTLTLASDVTMTTSEAITTSAVVTTGAATLSSDLSLVGTAEAPLTLTLGGTLDMAGHALKLGNVTLGGSLLQSLLDGSATSITLFTNVGTFNGETAFDAAVPGHTVFTNAAMQPGVGAYELAYAGGNITLTLVPEPATATLSLLALAGLAARRRRK